MLEFRCGWIEVVSVLQAEAVLQPATRGSASDIKLVFYSSTVTMMHVPINVRLETLAVLKHFVYRQYIINEI